MTSPEDRHKAFADALQQLYARYPLPRSKYQMVEMRWHQERNTAYRNALRGSEFYQIKVFAVKVPSDSLMAVYNLIYG
jgi:hypothetical protein